MALTFNGSTPTTITYNGNDVQKVVCNGATVWVKDATLYVNIGRTTGSASTSINAYDKPSGGNAVTITGATDYLWMPNVTRSNRSPVFRSSDHKIYWVDRGNISNAGTVYTGAYPIGRKDKLLMAKKIAFVDIYSDSSCQSLKVQLPYNSFALLKVLSKNTVSYQVTCINTGDSGYVNKQVAFTLLDLSPWDYSNYDNNL